MIISVISLVSLITSVQNAGAAIESTKRTKEIFKSISKVIGLNSKNMIRTAEYLKISKKTTLLTLLGGAEVNNEGQKCKLVRTTVQDNMPTDQYALYERQELLQSQWAIHEHYQNQLNEYVKEFEATTFALQSGKIPLDKHYLTATETQCLASHPKITQSVKTYFQYKMFKFQ